MSKDQIIVELSEMIRMQSREIIKLKKRINQLKQYLEVYEEYMQGE